jgi:hypothetical protein
MRQREFIRLVGGAAAWPLAVRAQQPALPRIGSIQSAPSDYGLSQFATHQAAVRQDNFEGRQNILSLVFFGPADGSRFFEQFGGSLHEPNR